MLSAQKHKITASGFDEAITTASQLSLVDGVNKLAGQSVIATFSRHHFYFCNMRPKEIKLHSTVYHKQMFFG